MEQTNKRIIFSDNQVSIKQSDNNNSPATLTGYAMKWNTLSSDRGGYFVRLLPGSATALNPTFAIVNHDYNNLLARTDDNSLRLSSDDIGIKFEIDMPDTQLGKDTTWLVANGKIKGMSFAMVPGGLSTETTEDGKDIVTFSKFDFDEVTITPIPAFEDTTVELKQDQSMSGVINLAKEIKSIDFSEVLRIEKYKLEQYRPKN